MLMPDLDEDYRPTLNSFANLIQKLMINSIEHVIGDYWYGFADITDYYLTVSLGDVDGIAVNNDELIFSVAREGKPPVEIHVLWVDDIKFKFHTIDKVLTIEFKIAAEPSI